jgi:hypothetical protein
MDGSSDHTWRGAGRPLRRGYAVVALVALCALLLPASAWAASGPLPFTLPKSSTLRKSPKKVFAHYSPQYVISQDNLPPEEDYYATEYLNTKGFGAAYAAFGGYLRDRPLPRAPLSGAWALKDMQTDVERAVSAGIDGFIVDAAILEPNYWLDRIKTLIKAAETVDPGFRIILMPNFTGQPRVSPARLARSLAALDRSPVLYRLKDRRLVISPWEPQLQGTAYWKKFMSQLEALDGTRVALVPCFLDVSANARAFAPISYGMATWGGRSPAAAPPTSKANPYVQDARMVHGLGKLYMQAISAQDVRPTQQLYWEANNTENLRYTWNSAIADADWVQLVTWNDYGEGTQIAPSVAAGWTWLDISSYYLTRFKTGAWPRIRRSGAYVTHRVQFARARPRSAGRNTRLMRPNFAPGQSVKPRDTIEVLSFLSAKAKVRVAVGSRTYRYVAPAGVVARRVPLGVGSVDVKGSGGVKKFSVRSPWTVRNKFTVQDLQYRAASSYRP